MKSTLGHSEYITMLIFIGSIFILIGVYFMNVYASMWGLTLCVGAYIKNTLYKGDNDDES